jgi:hypothetical protein
MPTHDKPQPDHHPDPSYDPREDQEAEDAAAWLRTRGYTVTQGGTAAGACGSSVVSYLLSLSHAKDSRLVHIEITTLALACGLAGLGGVREQAARFAVTPACISKRMRVHREQHDLPPSPYAKSDKQKTLYRYNKHPKQKQ